jgi:hypothetical protein
MRGAGNCISTGGHDTEGRNFDPRTHPSLKSQEMRRHHRIQQEQPVPLLVSNSKHERGERGAPVVVAKAATGLR